MEDYFLVGIQRVCVGGHSGRRRKEGRVAGGARMTDSDGIRFDPSLSSHPVFCVSVSVELFYAEFSLPYQVVTPH